MCRGGSTLLSVQIRHHNLYLSMNSLYQSKQNVNNSFFLALEVFLFSGFPSFLFANPQFFGWLIKSSVPQLTDKKENQIFLIYEAIQSGAVAMEMRKYFPIYEEAVSNL
jgi:hypothetical protein